MPPEAIQPREFNALSNGVSQQVLMISCYKIVRKRKIYISESLPSTSSTSQDKTVDPQQENWTLLTLMKVKRSFSRNIVSLPDLNSKGTSNHLTVWNQ